MYLGDVGELQSHLNNDWTIIFKHVKTMEDLHFDLLTYNKQVQTKQRIQDDDPFIKDQIIHHQQRIDAARQTLLSVTNDQTELMNKYEASIVSFDEILKLMGRVGARLLETYQSSIDKCESLDEELMDKYLKMKSSLIRILNQKDKINLEETIAIVITYSKAKLQKEVAKLKKIVAALENGDYERAQGQYIFKEVKPTPIIQKKIVPPPLAPSVSAEKKKISVQKVKVSSVGRQQRSPLWEQLKAQEKLKKQKQKIALRLVHGLYSTMDLARQQIIEDICSNQREKAKRLYNQIFSRNKFNHDQIVAFEAKKEEFHHKVQLFKAAMEQESKKIAEALRKPSVKRQRKKQDNLNFSKMEVEESEEEKIEELAESRKSNRYIIQSPKTKGKANQYPILIQCSQENFNHIRFQSNQNQSTYMRPNRNKLPFLYSQNVSQSINRANSFDQRADIKTKAIWNQRSEKKAEGEDILNHQALLIRNQKAKREERYISQRAKMPLKNIEVRVDGVMCHEEQGKPRSLKPNPMEYTFYVRRTNRFYEPNHNIIL